MTATRMDKRSAKTVWPTSATRRTFLKGVGLAGAAGLAAPLLTSTSASASGSPIILGANVEPWEYPAPQNWQAEVPGAQGNRAYRDTVADVFSTNSGCPTVFPGQQNSIPVASIKPEPSALLNGDLDVSIKALILDGMKRASSSYPGGQYFAGTPQLTVWYEAGNLYQKSPWTTYDTSPQTVRSMHVHMQNLCSQMASDYTQYTSVEYGCIIFGDIAKMANDSDTTQNYVPGVLPNLAEFPLDWYGVDVYYEGYGSGNLDGQALTNYMNAFRTMAQHRSGQTTPRVNVCECNANAQDDGARPGFFEDLAQWLYNNGGRRMLTFFPDPAGPESVTWSHVVNATTPHTIEALNSIQGTYGR